MSGEPNSEKKSAEDKLIEINRVLDEYTKSLGISTKRNVPDVSEYLEMDRSEISKLTPEESKVASIELCNFATYIQQETNRHIAVLHWAESNLDFITAKELDSYQGFGYKEKFLKALHGNIPATKLYHIKVQAQLRADELNFVASRVNSVADNFRSLYYAKKQGDV